MYIEIQDTRAAMITLIIIKINTIRHSYIDRFKIWSHSWRWLSTKQSGGRRRKSLCENGFALQYLLSAYLSHSKGVKKEDKTNDKSGRTTKNMEFINNSYIANSTEPSTVGSVSRIEQYEETEALYIFRLTLFSVIISASVIGNSMVCYADMVFAEILSSVCLAVMFASWQNPTDVVLQEAACILNPLQVVALLVVIYSLAAIAFYRYRFIVNPLPRGPSVKKITILTISGLWLLSFAIACPYFFSLRFRNGECIELPVANNEY